MLWNFKCIFKIRHMMSRRSPPSRRSPRSLLLFLSPRSKRGGRATARGKERRERLEGMRPEGRNEEVRRREGRNGRYGGREGTKRAAGGRRKTKRTKRTAGGTERREWRSRRSRREGSNEENGGRERTKRTTALLNTKL